MESGRADRGVNNLFTGTAVIYGWLLAGIMLVTSVAAYKIQTIRLDGAKAKVEILKQDKRTLQDAITMNEKALNRCVTVNQENAQAAAAQKQQAAQAITRLQQANALAGKDLARIEAEANDNRETHSDSRRTLVDPLPADLVGWMPVATD